MRSRSTRSTASRRHATSGSATAPNSWSRIACASSSTSPKPPATPPAGRDANGKLQLRRLHPAVHDARRPARRALSQLDRGTPARASFRRGTLISASSGAATAAPTTCCESPTSRLLDLLTEPAASHSFTLPARDEHGMETLAMIRDRGVNQAADALAQSVDHILGFFATLRAELASTSPASTSTNSCEQDRSPPAPRTRQRRHRHVQRRGPYDAALVFHLDGPWSATTSPPTTSGCS